MVPSSYPPITNNQQVTISGSVNGVIITPIISATTSFTLTVNDGTQSNSAIATVRISDGAREAHTACTRQSHREAYKMV